MKPSFGVDLWSVKYKQTNDGNIIFDSSTSSVKFQEENDEASEEMETHNRQRRDSSKENKNPTNKEHSTRENSNKNKKSTLEKSGDDEDSENERVHVGLKYSFIMDHLQT